MIRKCDFFNLKKPFTSYWDEDGSYNPYFNDWYVSSRFKDVFNTSGSAFVMKGPVTQQITLADGAFHFRRDSSDTDAHTMLEVSVNKTAIASYQQKTGFRTMGLGIPYEFSMDFMATGDDWWSNNDWCVVMQAHVFDSIRSTEKRPNPPFALVAIRGRWELHVRGDDRDGLSDRNYQRSDQIDLGPIEGGVWVSLRVRVIWDYDAHGALLVVKSGVERHREWGTKTFFNVAIDESADRIGPYVTFGAYSYDVALPIAMMVRNIRLGIG